MLEVMGENYIRAARAFGLPEWKVVYLYALNVAILPTITLVGIGFGNLLSSAVFAEIIFARPGMGKLIFDSIMGNDFNVAMVALLFATMLTLVGNLLADLAYSWLDPRISY